ncbi:MAG: transcriptional regulator [Tepidimonas sp.]|nr:transcriptional regulator [Tepidimonas sp.]
MAIWRMDECLRHAGYRTPTSIRELVRAGLWTRPVPIGARSVGWPSDEVQALCDARIAGLSEEQIRRLVNRLHEQRKQRAPILEE